MKVHRITIEPGDNGGGLIIHQFKPEMGRSGAFMQRPEPKRFNFGPGQHKEMIAHLAEHVPSVTNSSE